MIPADWPKYQYFTNSVWSGKSMTVSLNNSDFVPLAEEEADDMQTEKGGPGYSYLAGRKCLLSSWAT